MAEFDYQNVEAWNTAIRLTTAVGRLKVGSNLKASQDAQSKAFEQAGLASALIAEGAGREGPSQVNLYRDARGSLAQCRSWLHILAALMNEQDAVFGNEFDLAEQASRQLTAQLRNLERGPSQGAPPRPPMRGGPASAGGGPRGNPPRPQGGLR
jgi:hypothetical protein